MYIEEDQENDLYLQQGSGQNQKNDLYMEKELEKESGSDWDLEISLGIGVGIAIVVVGYFLFKKVTAPKTKTEEVLDGEAKKAMDFFIDEIILDYYNEYRLNYLSVRYSIKELAIKTSYVFKTKRIGSLSNIVNYNQVSSGEEYLRELILKRYDIVVSTDDKLSFITEVSRIEGKIKAVESVKAQIPEKDYNKLMSELEEDIIYYRRKYSTPGLEVE